MRRVITDRRTPFAIVAFTFVTLSGSAALADKVRIIESPNEAAQARIDLIQQAKKSIDAQYYIVGKDYFTFAGLSLLRDASRRGCNVRLIIDGRSNMLPHSVQAELQREHVQVKLYHPIALKMLAVAFHRMHDKGLTVDGKYMIRGGRNAEGDYFGYWKRNYVDRDVYVEGKAVTDSTAYFDRLWNSKEVAPLRVNDHNGRLADEGRKILDDAHDKLAHQKSLRLNSDADWSARSRSVAPVDFLHDPVGRKNIEFGIAQALRQELMRTHDSIVIETPYLIPTKEFFADLQQLRARGVKKIEIVTNSAATSDDVLVDLAYERAKPKLLALGVDLWELEGTDTLHAKSAVIDNRLALIGSFNMDPRSQLLNTETAVAIHDRAIAQQLRHNIDMHKPHCFHVRPNQLVADDQPPRGSFAHRVNVSILKILLPVLHAQL